MAGKEDAPLEALRMLRAHLIAGKPVEVEGEDLFFRDASGSELRRLPKHTPTAYHSKKLDKSYDLLAVHTCFKHADLSFSDYVLKCREDKAAMVSTVDKKELVAFLKGDIDSSPQILDASGKPTAASGEKDRKPTTKKTREPEDDARAAKKRKLAQEKENHRHKHGESHKTPQEVKQDEQMKRITDRERSVVGVIVSGQSWQFKGWKWKFPLEVFKKVCGVHIYNQGSQLNPEIKQWDVKVLMIHPDKRHLDKVAAKEFWRYLFAFIKHKLQ
ncbi:hypothetical protein AM588_10002954 [Phytophthora nicotianae]|uniref:Cell division control protein 73 C-terminal domain-containing protein n=1 Tax=Phytophthora nicotianae TaxID=4792 RepID=A0A0W8D476_PHYNI|nr:hypothetical protein AM588_10002954 [Phytophthora nicotianae]